MRTKGLHRAHPDPRVPLGQLYLGRKYVSRIVTWVSTHQVDKKLRASKLAAVSRTSAKATSAATSMLRTSWCSRVPDIREEEAFNASMKFARDPVMAGAAPKTTAERSATPIPNPKTNGSRETFSSHGSSGDCQLRIV